MRKDVVRSFAITTLDSQEAFLRALSVQHKKSLGHAAAFMEPLTNGVLQFELAREPTKTPFFERFRPSYGP